jgi:hypothetical protein
MFIEKPLKKTILFVIFIRIARKKHLKFEIRHDLALHVPKLPFEIQKLIYSVQNLNCIKDENNFFMNK